MNLRSISPHKRYRKSTETVVHHGCSLFHADCGWPSRGSFIVSVNFSSKRRVVKI